MFGPCPTQERLSAALRGLQPSADDAALAAHVAECPACQARLEALAGGSGWLETKAKTHAAAGRPASKALDRLMQELEARPGLAEEPTPPPKLDFLQPCDDPALLGKFGPYEVIAHVASGGMGIVLKARDPALQRVVALKILSPLLAANPMARARFIREARAAAAVVHDNVVPIYAVDEWAGLPYIVMQFVHGRSLSERIRLTGPLRLEEILRIGAQTAAGLAVAHAQGLVHRDVKPGNILLENSIERVKLTDFGLARAVDDSGITRTGELAGTPEFMAPEQADNEPVDHRADLFSLGTVLYAMSAGFSPFQGQSVLAVIRQVCDAQPRSLQEINSNIPSWLNDIITKLMAKAPADRFQSAKEVSDLLEGYLARVQRGELGAIKDKPSSQRARPARKLPYAIATAVVVLAGLLIVRLRMHTSAPSSTPSVVGQPAFAVRDGAGKLLGSYENLEEAGRAVPSPGIIELCWNGDREMPPVKLPAKLLTLRAGPGFHPVWVHTIRSEPALQAVAALTLQNLEFVLRADDSLNRRRADSAPPLAPRATPPRQRDWQSPRPGDRQFPPPREQQEPSSSLGLISISNGPVRVSSCMFQLREPWMRWGLGPSERSRTAIVLEDVVDCELANTLVFGLPGQVIVWRQIGEAKAGLAPDGESRLYLSNCIVQAFQTVRFELAEEARTRLEMVRCTFEGPHFILFPESSAGRALTVIAQSNLFATGTMIEDHGTNRGNLASSMRWRGTENVFGPKLAYIAFRLHPDEGRVMTLTQWNRWWQAPEQGSREVFVEFVPVANTSPTNSAVAFARQTFKVVYARLSEGAPLDSDVWSRIGADPAAVGPAFQ